MPATSMVLEPLARTGGLLSAALPLTGEWQRGVDVLVAQYEDPARTGPCSSVLPEAKGRGDVERFKPVVLSQRVKCSALGNPDVEGAAVRAVDVTGPWGLSEEFYDGAATGNPSLSDATPLPSALDLREAFSMLEARANQDIPGQVAFLHVPVDLAAYVRASLDEAGRLRTVAGNVVVIHGAGNTVYATGTVWAAYESIGGADDTERGSNTRIGKGQAVGLAVFDPAFNLSVQVLNPTSTS
jgi:hypothetical protein